MKSKRLCDISLRFQFPNTILIHFHSFKTTTKCPFYSPSSYHLPRLILLCLFKKVVKTIFSRFELKIMSRERKSPQWSESAFLREEEGGEGRSKVWWPMECSKLGGQWNVPLSGGQWKVKEKHLFTYPHFPPNKFYLNLQFFPLTSRFYFTMVLSRYSCISFFFFNQ